MEEKEIKEQQAAEPKKRKGMTLPNKLTLLRIILIPVIIVLYYIPWMRDTMMFNDKSGISVFYFVAFFIFAIASLTDFLDGYIARKYNLVTTFGKFADPLADKLLVFTTMLIFMLEGDFGYKISDSNLTALIPMWAFAVMLIREFAVSGIRMVASSKGVVIAAGWSGKVKTFVTMIALMICFFAGAHIVVYWIAYGLIMVSVFLTIYSGIEYFWKSRKIIFESI